MKLKSSFAVILLILFLNNSKVSTSSDSDFSKFKIPKRFQESSESIWVEYVALAAKYKPVNLGQGFPDYPPPVYMKKFLSEVANGNHLLNQYTRGFGHPRLVNALSKLYSQYIGREINPMSEVLVTVGAYQSLYNSIMGHVEEGDEVIIFEPYYICYYNMIRAAGGTVKTVTLKPTKSGVILSSDWKFDEQELESLFTNNTKVLILNTPQNPIGKVYSIEELEIIANLCKKWNVMVISDEVYEHMVYEPKKHLRINTLPGMWERTITIGSAGKTFSATGWKIGWSYGPANLIRNLQIVHQNSIYTCATPLQEALALAFELELSRLSSPESFFNSIKIELQEKRDFMAKFLTESGFEVTLPEGGYFLIANWTRLSDRIDLSSETDTYKDYQFTKWMTKNIALQGIPPSAFYTKPNKHLGENFVRYCFGKKNETLEEAANILKNWK